MAKGDLCYKSGGNALCFKRGGSALVCKGDGLGDITVRVPWTPQHYVCTTYSQYHEISFSVSGAWTVGGGGAVLSQDDGGSETVIVIARPTARPAVFTLSISCSTPCSATDEDPGVSCDVFATQTGAHPLSKRGVSAPRTATGAFPATVSLSFDADGKLTGVS